MSLNACLPEVTHLGLGDEFFADGLECHLNGIVAVVLNRFNLSDGAGSCQNNGHGDHRSVLTEKLSHADFFTQNCLFHCLYLRNHSLISMSTPAGRSSFISASTVFAEG